MTMYTKDEARACIAELVAQFRQNEGTLENAPEAQIENNYIRPLFRFLNWNVDNTGLSEAQWEFVLQRTTREGKKPDYVLRLDGQDLLVMDAKKVKHSMRDPRWINQVYAYAYSTQNNPAPRKIDFAILTDFQEFVVLDCTLYAARPEAAGTFRVLDWRCADYVDRFDELWELFERDNVRAASRDRQSGLWARYLSPKKVKANRIPPDKAFLASLDDEKTGWRVRLAKDMKKRNPRLDGDVLTAAVQLLIDRLIFVKALSDREIEEDYLAQMEATLAKVAEPSQGSAWDTCRSLFDKLNTVYDGSVFAPRPELEAVEVSNKTVREIIRDLQPEYSAYNFAVLPVEILGTIYERFLGRVVRATEQRVKIEDKPEVRKAGGVYYTPQYIVEYIVQNTVGRLLAGCKTPADVAKLKILDPACGSGSFLLGAYEALIDWHTRYYGDKERLTRRDREAAYYDADGRVRLTARLKRQILLNNLFGVDIDPQAVEVTRFSLSLKALEDTRHDELYEEVTLFKQTVLPDLSQNIKCGNSLIGTDYFAGQMFTDAEELKRVRPFDWEREFPQVFTPSPALPRVAGQGMGGGEGFDAIIGNPPYIRIQTMKEWAPLEVELYKQKYVAAGTGNYDIYVVFVEKGLSLLNERGQLGFIVPNKFFQAKYGESLRGIISGGRHLAHVVHFGSLQVFDGATTYTCLMFLDKPGEEHCDFVQVHDLKVWAQGEPQKRGFIPATAITASEWNFTADESGPLLEKLRSMPIRLGNIADRIFQGIIPGADKVYSVELLDTKGRKSICYSRALQHTVEIETALLKGIVSGAEVKRYSLSETAMRVIYPYQIASNGECRLIEQDDMAQNYPLAFAYFKASRRQLDERDRGSAKGVNWYRYIRTQNIGLQPLPKLAVPRLVSRLCCAYDAEGVFCLDNVDVGGVLLSVEARVSPLYVMGLLNSKLLDFYFRRHSVPFRGNYFSANRQYIENLPIRPINFSDPADKAAHDEMVRLVERMLTLRKQLASARTEADRAVFQRQIEATDRDIDARVYRLYGLTEEEIRIVEG